MNVLRSPDRSTQIDHFVVITLVILCSSLLLLLFSVSCVRVRKRLFSAVSSISELPSIISRVSRSFLRHRMAQSLPNTSYIPFSCRPLSQATRQGGDLCQIRPAQNRSECHFAGSEHEQAHNKAGKVAFCCVFMLSSPSWPDFYSITLRSVLPTITSMKKSYKHDASR